MLQALFDLEATNNELKADLRDLYITSAKEVDAGSRKAIIVHVSSSAGGHSRRWIRHTQGTAVSRAGVQCRRWTGSARGPQQQLHGLQLHVMSRGGRYSRGWVCRCLVRP